MFTMSWAIAHRSASVKSPFSTGMHESLTRFYKEMAYVSVWREWRNLQGGMHHGAVPAIYSINASTSASLSLRFDIGSFLYRLKRSMAMGSFSDSI